jgi:hypothetical protein
MGSLVSRASGSNDAKASGAEIQQREAATAEAQFQRATQQTPPAPVVYKKGGFRSLAAAARHAIAEANPVSIEMNQECGGNFFWYKSLGRERYGYTGPRRGHEYTFCPTDPVILPPRDTRFAGSFHTHGAYEEFDPNKPQHIKDSFSEVDILIGIDLARGKDGETPEQREQRIIRDYGVPPVEGKNMRFYLGTPSGVIREHDPLGRPSLSSPETIAVNPYNGVQIPNGGIDRELPPSSRRIQRRFRPWRTG